MNATNLKESVITWAESLNVVVFKELKTPISTELHRSAFDSLTQYWRLALLSRSTTDPVYAEKAKKIVFRVRTILERSLAQSIKDALYKQNIEIKDLFKQNIFSESIKQGLSFRLPLSSCVPTTNCHWSCYAHDGMDAGRYPIIKGAINGVIAELYENEKTYRPEIEFELRKHISKAIKKAVLEARKAGFHREARIRFSHVGEIANFPDFANRFAKLVHEMSQDSVRCIVYTRHPNAQKLDSTYFVINFTLDADSRDRKKWVPEKARIVFTAWSGEVDSDAEVNFLEHHRFQHFDEKGTGQVCPVTIVKNKLDSCDKAQCDVCFRHPKV